MCCSNLSPRVPFVLFLSLAITWTGRTCVLAQAPAASRSSPLRYGWQEGQVFAYDVEITADRDEYVDTMKGVISYTPQAARGDQLKVTYHGGVKRARTPKPGQSSGAARPGIGRPPFGPRFGPPGFPRGPRGLFDTTPFKGLTTTTNKITLTSQGSIQSLEGDSQLPYLLGNLSLMVFEPLPDEAQSSWTVGSGVTITEEKGRRTGPPFFGRPPGFPGGPFGQEGPDKETAGSETVSLSIENDNGKLVTANKRYQLNSPTTDGESFEITGSGKWVFNRELAVSESLDFDQQLIVRDDNTTVTVPVTIKYRRLSENELAKHQEQQQKQQEELKQKLAEMQQKRAEKPLSTQDKKEILDNLKSDNVSRVLRALQRLQGKSPQTPDREIAAAVRSLRGHQNRLVQQLAEKVAAKWSAPGDAGTSAEDASSQETTAPAKGLRTWTDNTGEFKIEAEFLGLADGQVRLRRTDGREISVPLTRLSEADQKVAQELSEKTTAASNPFDP